MSKIVEIESALERINGDVFQDFCNHFLYLKLNPNSITPIGSVIGKEKSRKGIPDSYFKNSNDELIFAEYTTKERIKTSKSFFKKLQSDIKNCFNTLKTGLKPEEIDKVVLCFTDRIKPEEHIQLELLCKKYNPKCVLELKGIRDLAFAVLDHPTLGRYIGINIGTDQILEPSEFIANYEKNKISTPLSNTFWGREKEIADGFKCLEENNILLIFGSAGAGKSKFAIELAKRYSDLRNVTFLCIGNKGISIWEDLKTMIRKDKQYVLLIDDANRLANNFQLILSLLEDSAPNGLKIIATVRDYAFPVIKTIASKYEYSVLEIHAFSNDEIVNILKSPDFQINDPAYLDRILNISKGNARLAIMCAKIALRSSNITLLHDASQIYDEYFEPLYSEVLLLKEPITLKTLALISFFSRIDKSNRGFCDNVFGRLEISENLFWETCYSLHEYELVDLFEQQVVKISDQIFATYIFYEAVIESEVISLNFFLDNYLDYENRIKDTLMPVLNMFNYKKIEHKLKPIILDKWVEIEKHSNFQKSLKYIDLFWFYLGPQFFVFLKKHIDGQEWEHANEYRYTYERNEFSHGVGTDLDILSRYRFHEDELFKDSLELLCYYAFHNSSKMPALIFLFKETYCFSRLGYLNDYRIQHMLFNLLIENAKSDENKIIYENLLAEILPHFLKIEFKESEGNGRAFTLYTFHLGLSESIKSFREKCFSFLLSTANKKAILRVLSHVSSYEYKDCKEILQFDKAHFFKIIDKHLSPDLFEDCFVVQNIFGELRWLDVKLPPLLVKKFKVKMFRLAEILHRDRQRKRELGWEEEIKWHEKELLDYCRYFELSDYNLLFENVVSILNAGDELNSGNFKNQYASSMDTIFCNLAKTDKNLFLEVLKLNFGNFLFNLNYNYVFNCFFHATPQQYFELYEVVRELKENIKFSFHLCININFVEERHLQIFYNDLINTINSISKQYIFWDLTFISKYTKLKDEKEIYYEVLNMILTKIKKEEVKISVGEPFLERCIKFDDFSIDLLIEGYLYSNRFEQHFDYKKKIFKGLLQRDSNLIIKYLIFNTPNRISYHDLEFEHFDFIWELENITEIITSIFEYFIATETFHFSERAVSAFFPQLQDKFENKPINYLKEVIDLNFVKIKYMEFVFSIICYKYPTLKMDFLERFLKLNSDINDFKNLEIIQRSRGWTGSYIPILEEEITTWNNVLLVIESLPKRLDYIEHKEYVSCMTEYCKSRIKEEMIREFYDDFR